MCIQKDTLNWKVLERQRVFDSQKSWESGLCLLSSGSGVRVSNGSPKKQIPHWGICFFICGALEARKKVPTVRWTVGGEGLTEPIHNFSLQSKEKCKRVSNGSRSESLLSARIIDSSFNLCYISRIKKQEESQWMSMNTSVWRWWLWIRN